MKTKQVEDPLFLDKLSQRIYTPANIERANEYMVSRKLDPQGLRYPWTMTDGNSTKFKNFSKYPESIFIDSLFIPVPHFQHPEIVDCYDVRYVGTSDGRTRFHKMKRAREDSIIVYNIHAVFENPTWPVVVVESAIDAESIRSLNLPVVPISPLTAQFGNRFSSFLYAISNDVLICYDNDPTGIKATSKIKSLLEPFPEVSKSFTYVFYSGFDPNDSLCTLGRCYLKEVISNYL